MSKIFGSIKLCCIEGFFVGAGGDGRSILDINEQKTQNKKKPKLSLCETDTTNEDSNYIALAIQTDSEYSCSVNDSESQDMGSTARMRLGLEGDFGIFFEPTEEDNEARMSLWFPFINKRVPTLFDRNIAKEIMNTISMNINASDDPLVFSRIIGMSNEDIPHTVWRGKVSKQGFPVLRTRKTIPELKVMNINDEEYKLYYTAMLLVIFFADDESVNIIRENSAAGYIVPTCGINRCLCLAHFPTYNRRWVIKGKK